MENQEIKEEDGKVKDSTLSNKKMINIGNLLSRSFEDYKNNFSKAIIFMLVPMLATIGYGLLIALLVSGMIGTRYMTDSVAVSGISAGVSMALIILATVVMILIDLVAMIGIFLIFRDSNENLTVNEILSRAKKDILGYLWVSILTGILVFLWSLLLVIPGIIFGLYYTLSAWVFFKEGKRGMEAIKRSHELIKGYWWAVFGRLVLAGVIFVAISSVLQAIVPGKSGEIVSNAISWLFGPFMIIYQLHIYKSLVDIKGGAVEETEKSIDVDNTKNKTESVVEKIEEIKEDVEKIDEISEKQKKEEKKKDYSMIDID